MIPVKETADGVTFAVSVKPRARRSGIVGELGESLKIALKAPPVDGRANEECIRFFAAALSLPRSSITIVGGHSGRNKIIHIAGITARDLRLRFGI